MINHRLKSEQCVPETISHTMVHETTTQETRWHPREMMLTLKLCGFSHPITSRKSVHHDTLLTLKLCCFSKSVTCKLGGGELGGVEKWGSSNIWKMVGHLGLNSTRKLTIITISSERLLPFLSQRYNSAYIAHWRNSNYCQSNHIGVGSRAKS